MPDTQPILAHYGTADLVGSVGDALAKAGFATGTIPREALAPLDQFHVGGAAATKALATALAIPPGAKVLDVGCGLGGPSRHLAALHGADVTGVDLSPAFVGVANLLTERTGLAAQVRHQVADATALPFDAESFDLAWSQHVAMNIADRSGLYAGVFRVLKPGGRFAFYDIVAGDAGPPHFPVPWARDPEHSFLLTADATRAVLEQVGFTVLEWTDATATGIAAMDTQAATARERPDRLRPLALPLVMGPDFPVLAANLGRNLREGRVRLLQAVLQRPG